MKIELEISEQNEGTDAPYWLILDPVQNMRADYHALAGQITGPFFSREEAQRHLDVRRYAFGKKAVVYCFSGYHSHQYKSAFKKASENKKQETL